MKKSISILIFVIGITALFSSCKKSRDVTPVVKITGQENGKTTTILQGQTLQINLPNPGDGGYTFDPPQYNSSVISLGNHTHNPPLQGTSIGNFGTDTWAFYATKTGSTTLTITATQGTDKSSTVVIFSGIVAVN
jgi:predicted secreted protein